MKKKILIILIVLIAIVSFWYIKSHKGLDVALEDSRVLVDSWGNYTVQENGIIYSSGSILDSATMYYDFKTAESYVLCSKSGCSHLTESCPAYREAMESGHYTYNGALWRVCQRDSGLALVKSNIDGTNKQDVVYIKPEDQHAEDCENNLDYYQGNQAYYVIRFHNFGSQDVKTYLLNINLDNGEKKYLFELNQNAEVRETLMGIYGENALVRAIHDNPPLTESEFYAANGQDKDYNSYAWEWYQENGYDSYLAVNLKDGCAQEIVRINGSYTDEESGKNFINGKFYFVTGNELHYIDMNDLTSGLLYQDADNMSIQCASSKGIFLLRLEPNGSDRKAFLYYDLENEAVKEFPEDSFGGKYAWFMDCTEDYVLGSRMDGLSTYQLFALPMESALKGSKDGLNVFKSSKGD